MTSMILITLMQVSALGAETSTFEQAYQQSQTTGRPLVVLIGATWCPGCQIMKNSTLPEVERAGGLKQVIFFYVDFDQQRELAARLKRASSIPQLIRFDQTATGWKSKCLVGAKSFREVYDFINKDLPEQIKVNEVSITKHAQKNTRKPPANNKSKSKKDTSQSSTTSTNAPQSNKRKSRPILAKKIVGPSIWRPLYNTPTTEPKVQSGRPNTAATASNTRSKLK